MDRRAVLVRYHWSGGMIAVSSVCLPSIIAVERVDQSCDATSAAAAHWRESEQARRHDSKSQTPV